MILFGVFENSPFYFPSFTYGHPTVSRRLTDSHSMVMRDFTKRSTERC